MLSGIFPFLLVLLGFELSYFLTFCPFLLVLTDIPVPKGVEKAYNPVGKRINLSEPSHS